MSQFRDIVCALPILICSNQRVPEVALNIVRQLTFISQFGDLIPRIQVHEIPVSHTLKLHK
jgi:hypothetical protein